jgi:hypothetical protein
VFDESGSHRAYLTCRVQIFILVAGNFFSKS